MINGAGMAVRTVGKTKKKKRAIEEEKTKMTTKWNLINLDVVLLLTNSGQKKRKKGNCFFGMC